MRKKIIIGAFIGAISATSFAADAPAPMQGGASAPAPKMGAPMMGSQPPMGAPAMGQQPPMGGPGMGQPPMGAPGMGQPPMGGPGMMGTPGMMRGPMMMEKEKCYGVAKAGKNDCDAPTAGTPCPGSMKDGDPKDWIMLPKGLCERLVNGVAEAITMKPMDAGAPSMMMKQQAPSTAPMPMNQGAKPAPAPMPTPGGAKPTPAPMAPTMPAPTDKKPY